MVFPLPHNAAVDHLMVHRMQGCVISSRPFWDVLAEAE